MRPKINTDRGMISRVNFERSFFKEMKIQSIFGI